MTTRATYTNIDSLGMISRIDGTTTLVYNYEYCIGKLKMISRTPLTQQQIDNLRAAGWPIPVDVVGVVGVKTQ